MADLRPVTCCFPATELKKCRSGTRTVPLRSSCLPHSMLRSRRPPLTAVHVFSPACPPALTCGPLRPSCARVWRSRCSCCAPYRSTDRPIGFRSSERRFNRCLLAADKVYALSRSYHAGCFAARNRFMVDASSRLICYYDGRSGGTAQTVHMAEQSGLKIVNLADGQLSLL